MELRWHQRDGAGREGGGEERSDTAAFEDPRQPSGSTTPVFQDLYARVGTHTHTPGWISRQCFNLMQKADSVLFRGRPGRLPMFTQAGGGDKATDRCRLLALDLSR